ncbi:aspartate aminotransferase family protein [Persicitalea jodogahamensis]|uniref:Aspartate aminotransferase family protein n=1 Tax=Persicitalea jodogahamensis TaxID=402147 RepID=A0A8J3DC81_9BACT|nr:aminotransferase class III-fold pyridoxal phosphate-dependent enzyme [Persicitalea jodogahamensis]GHB81798.1 aspartate aminotransferase family protein [Persicitalea jodogahamensis]
MHLSQRQLFFDHLAQTSDFPLALEIERAEGVFLYGPDGQRYFDLISGIAVSNVGHRHPEILSAIHDQLDKYMHLMVYGEFVQSPQVKLAEALVKTLDIPCQSPSPFGLIDSVYFTNSGTEAVEGAMKLAKRFTGRSEFISCYNAYHGATQGALSISGAEFFKRNFRPLLPGIKQIRHGHLPDLEQITCRTAAVIIEVIGGESGVRIPPAEYFTALRQRCSDVGALLIFDEIQTGFGRTGTFWAFEHVEVYPDILLSAKGMGGGMPIGAFMAPTQLMAVFKNNPILGHITTFGGHPVCCAASLATLQIIQSANLAEEANSKGNLIKSLLIHPKIKEVRGQGLMLAAEMESFEVLKPVIDCCILAGVITDWFLFCDNSMRIAPPLTISEKEIQDAIGIIMGELG